MKSKIHIYWKPTAAFGRVVFAFLAILALAACSSNPAPAFDRDQVTAQLDAGLEQTVRKPGGSADRNVLLLVDAPTVKFIYEGAAGLARVDTQETITSDWQFNVASVAKAMTAVVIYQLAEAGEFGMDGINTRLAELDVLPAEVLARLSLIDGVSYGDQITLRQLLTHTSGLRDLYFDGVDNPVSLMPGTADGAAPGSLVGMAAFDERYGLTPLVDCTLEGIPAGCNPDDYLFRHKWSVWDYAAWQANPADGMAGLLNFYLAGMNEHALSRPGEGFHYSDTNYVLLGLVIEKVTGKSLHHELRARIFDPLGMNDTYLIGAAEPPADGYAGRLAEVWAWGEPAHSGGVDFSFDWGGGGIISTLADLHTFVRALAAGDLFQMPGTLDEMLAVPEDIHGISYASGLIVFPSESGPVWHMMGSNGTWVEYFPPLDLVTIGTVDDFSNLPGEFMLHGQVFAILASQGLNTPMARMSSLPTLLFFLSLMLQLLLTVGWLIGNLIKARGAAPVPASIRLARWLSFAAMLGGLVLVGLVGSAIGENAFQMLFGFSPQVRGLFLVGAFLMGAIALGLGAVTLRLWQRREGRLGDRVIPAIIALTAIVFAISAGLLA